MYQATNTTNTQQNIGGKVLYPGESRPIEDHEVHEALAKKMSVPGYEPPQPEAPPPPPAPPMIEEQLKRPVKELVELLPEMPDTQLLEMEAAEKKAEVPRETLLKAFEKEIARRSTK